MHILIMASAVMATAVAAQTLTLPFLGYDTQSIDASIVNVADARTTMALACPPGTDGNNCGLFPYQTLTLGSGVYHMDLNGGADFTGTQDCSVALVSATVATCTESNGGSGANFPGQSTTVYSSSDVVQIPVTVTAGADKLSGGNGATSTSVIISSGTTSVSIRSSTTTSHASSLSGSSISSSSTSSGGAAGYTAPTSHARSAAIGVAAGMAMVAWL